MSTLVNKQIVLASRPQAEPSADRQCRPQQSCAGEFDATDRREHREENAARQSSDDSHKHNPGEPPVGPQGETCCIAGGLQCRATGPDQRYRPREGQQEGGPPQGHRQCQVVAAGRRRDAQSAVGNRDNDTDCDGQGKERSTAAPSVGFGKLQ